MKKNGFTLIELLAVVVLIAIITTVSVMGVAGVRESIQENIWSSTINLVETKAITYGEDHIYIFDGKHDIVKPCKFDFNGDGTLETENNCLKTDVDSLISKGYISTKETGIIRNDVTGENEEKKVLINNTLEKTDANYYINKHCVLIYKVKEKVYAKYTGESC